MIFARNLYIKIAVIIGFTFFLTTAIIYFSINNTFNNIINSFMTYRLDSALQEVNADFGRVINTTEKISGTVKANYKTMTKTDYELMLKELVSSRDSIFGAGVWFEPYMNNKERKYFGPYVFRDNGKMTYSESWESDSYDYFRKEWYTNVFTSNDHSAWTVPYVDEILKITFVTASKKIVATDGNTIGVATADINISKIRNDINYSLRLSDNSSVFIVDSEGTFIVLNNQDEILKASEVQGDQLLSNIARNMTAISMQTSYYNENMNGDNIVYIKKTDYPGWYIGIAVPRKDVLDVIRTSFITISGAILFLAFVILLIMRLSTTWIKHIFFENTGTAAAIIDQDLKISIVNKDFSELTGYRKAELKERRFSELISAKDLETMKSYLTSLKKALKNDEPRYEIQLESKDKVVKDILISMGLITGTKYYTVSLIDITNRRTMEKRLEYLSFHDVLTGLYNRTYFEEALKSLESEDSYAMIICDVDNQKLVNDTFGHAVGDQKLINVSNLISVELETQDIAARIGGDEFAIILKGERSVLAEELCERMHQRIEEYNSTQTIILISMSFGVAQCNNRNKTCAEVFIEADNNMYREKMKYKQSDSGSKIESFIKLIEARDYEKEGHSKRLIELSAKIAAEYQFSERKTSELKLLARYHDIGKIGISDLIISKAGPLTSNERQEIQRHSEIGFNIAKSSRELSNIAEFILKHHEWWNGEGYPLCLKGEAIPLESRIVSVLDAYDAMTKDRTYRKAMTHEEAMLELHNGAGTQFDPSVVNKFSLLFN